MLQPRTYPELIGKALVLEAGPFVTMTDDDNPWAEGLFMIVVVGVLVGVAQFIGGLLMTASLPSPDAVLAALLQGWRHLGAVAGVSVDPAQAEASLRQAWNLAFGFVGYGSGWVRLWVVMVAPFVLLVQWLIYGLVGYGVAYALGGRGTLDQTLGATALIVAPQVFVLFKIIPFVSVSSAMLAVWALLIAYRALEVTHDLPWQRAVVAAVAPPAVLILLSLIVAGFVAALLVAGGLL